MSNYSSLFRVLSPFRVQTKFEDPSPMLNPKRYMADITLYCYLLGTPVNSAISVDIGEMTRVEGVDVPIGKFSFGHLKKQIWPNNNEANNLRLWKFETPLKKDNEKLKVLNKNFFNDTDLEQELGEDLSPGELIRTIFPAHYVFSPNHIHIIVEPPKPATTATGKKRPADSESIDTKPKKFRSDVSSSKSFKIISTGSFDALRLKGGYYLDKTHFIPKIEALETSAVLSLRPRRFGKTLFLSTLSSYYDVKNREQFEQLFQDLYIGKNPTPLASEFLILKFNFAGLRTNETYEIFKVDFFNSLNADMSLFMCKYKQELGSHFQVDKKVDALTNFKYLLNAVVSSSNKLYIFIDEYDASMNEALKNESLLKVLTNHHKNEGDSTKCKLESIEGSFKQFFSRLKTACDEDIARVFLTGVTPVVMAEFTSGFNISVDLALKKEFWDLYGFKKSEVKFLLDKVFENDLSDDIKEKIMSWLKDENDGYFFHRNQPEGIFNTARALYCISNLMEQKNELDCSWNPLDTLLNFPPDPQTLPSQTTLDLIVNNPLGKSILTEALSKCPLNSTDGIEQRFRLTNIRELATDRTPLLSFMFYTGAITYEQNLSPASEHNFRIPNRIAEREFVTEALRIYDWKKEDLIPVRKCLQVLEANYNIEPLCRFIEKALLKPLKDNSIMHSNEEALKQAFMDTLILTLHAEIEPEFQVYSHSPNSGGKAIDLVKTSAGKMIAIEFDNIKMYNVKLDGTKGSSWQKSTEVSRSLLEKSDDEILSLEISDNFRPNLYTVREALELKIKTKIDDYLDPLKNQHNHNAKLSCMFIVLRVGLHRLISRKVYDSRDDL